MSLLETYIQKKSKDLIPLDIVYSPCLDPLTELGKVIKELMIDNYKIFLTNRNWIETDHLRLHFELVDHGEADIFLINALRLRT